MYAGIMINDKEQESPCSCCQSQVFFAPHMSEGFKLKIKLKSSLPTTDSINVKKNQHWCLMCKSLQKSCVLQNVSLVDMLKKTHQSKIRISRCKRFRESWALMHKKNSKDFDFLLDWRRQKEWFKQKPSIWFPPFSPAFEEFSFKTNARPKEVFFEFGLGN